MWNLFKKKETEPKFDVEAYNNMQQELEDKMNEYAKKWKEDNPLKYKPKETFLHWIVLSGKQDVRIWRACGIICNNDWKNLYTVINFNTGETKEVDEVFMDNLKYVAIQ